ncbi:hypothetical protein ACN23B_21235 [Anabaena sp. FACHB-709]|jgi:uncharacterized protein with PQ loop repeat|uniref:Uncharacterized protein n=2 Tax=Nostocaceae TaxID=1162 RepID=A0A1Z4KLJ0_ANAVA|nr:MULTISPECIES: hypothetical protein [Nostocaceae]BAY69846.1 hypothetical protein NIES23_26460 [Trichormus variabilis NIES-23]HBW33209.1 hypothetical protein [Nostoc sp. UBA8866]MBD2172783.1 hypothetical protein [Anabaena cylindrica FACHB-318]MBD2264592.1 hypothetical protein [Anabaena sp. FACHB-709]MBD2273712.1 hypothetical protein [Nostoc sp. PCC 7120 = FACHB-418]
MNIKQTLTSIIKVISTILISTAIGLELWNIYAVVTNSNIPSILNPIFWVERFAVSCHLLEGIIAAFYAPSKKKMPIQYGIYTFFVGTVGLLELFSKESEDICNIKAKN